VSNPKALSLLAILVILALAFWRVVTGRATDRFRTVWAAGLFALGIAFATDLQPGLGAAISFAVLVFFLIRTFSTPAGAAQGAQPAQGARPKLPFGGGSSGATPKSPAYIA